MSTTCEDVIPLLAAQPEGLLEDGERSTLEAHLLVCETCPVLAQGLQASLAAATLEEREPSPAVWELIEAKIRDEREGRGPQTALRILLACTFCHGPLDRKEAVYCAACLAPHHQDCIETHGRCAATGCGETRSVAPRSVVARKRSRLRWALVVALAATGGAGAVAALERRPGVAALPPTVAGRDTAQAPVDNEAALVVPLPGSPEALALTDEPGTQAPDYPWAPPSNAVTKKLESQKLTFNFNATPFSEVVQFLQDFTGLQIRVSKAIDQDQVKVNLRVRDVQAWNVLLIIADQTGFKFEVEEAGIHLAPGEEIPAERAWPKPFDVSGLFDAAADEVELVRRLDSQRITLNFDRTPFADAVDVLHDLTSINFVIAIAAQDQIDSEQLKVKMKMSDASVREALDILLSSGNGLAWEVRNGIVLIRLASEATPSALASKLVSIDLRGGTVVDLVQALGAQGVEAFASPSAWRSRGTFSLHVVGRALGETLAALGSAATLAGRIVKPGDAAHEVVALEGRVVSVREALGAPLPAFSGVAAEVRELRERMMSDLASRHRARASRSTKDAELIRQERSVDLAACSILSLLKTTKRIAGSEKHARSIAKRLNGIERDLPRARDALRDAQLAIDTRVPPLEARIAALDSASLPGIAALAKRVGELDKDVRSVETDRVDAVIRARREHEEALRTYKDARDALDQELTATKRELETKRVKCEREVESLEAYEKDLLREDGAVRRDQDALSRLQRGMRLAEAENPD